MNIEMPDYDDRERSIQTILDSVVPAKRSIINELKRLMNTVGIKYAFCGVGDAVTAALILSLGIVFSVSFISAVERTNALSQSYLFLPVLIPAPIFYFSMLVFTSWKERMTGTWAVLESCRYNLKYITAVRIIIISAAGMVFIPIATLPLFQTAEYPRIIASAFCAVFLFGALTLLSLLKSEAFFFQLAVPVLWTVSWGILLSVFSSVQIEMFLSKIPLAFSGILACVLLVIYTFELRIFVFRITRRYNS